MENTVFTQKDIDDLTKKMKDEYDSQMLLFAQQLQNTISSNFIASQKKNYFSKKFTVENVTKMLENPQKNEKDLRELSMVLMTLSPQYKQICNYYSSIAKFVPILNVNVDKFSNAKGEIADVEKIRKDYFKAVAHLERMNIPHEFLRILNVATRDDVFYGYKYETNDSFYIQQLDPDYCRISTVSDGCYNYQFDFSYFDGNNKLKDIEGILIESYPLEFQQKYNDYLKDKSNMKWQELDEKNTICIKFLETLPFTFPPYASLFYDLSDLADYKEIGKNKEENSSYKFIGMEIPINEKSEKADDFLVNPSTVLKFHNMMNAGLPNGISSFISPTPFKSIDFNSNSSADKSKVLDAENSLFASSGISPINFGKADVAGTVKYSNMVDEGTLFNFYRQCERWLNRYFKFNFNGKFIIKLMDVTVFSLGEEIDRQLKLAQFGIPNKLILSSLVGVTQGIERGMTFLEDDILNLSELWKPLQSSHTQTSDDGGRPTKDDRDLGESGQSTRDNGSNENR